MRGDGILSDAIGYLVWAAIYTVLSAPFWLPILAFAAGAWVGAGLIPQWIASTW